ncbi:MAG TPA: redox-sensing transcriptional repressor Rex [bacterium]|nr:redox-sensing transcriptional repressor Rex [bacterium]
MGGKVINPKVIERLILYRRSLLMDGEARSGQIYSHEMAVLAGVSAPQVRRDVMAIGYSGSPITGYDRQALLRALGEMIDPPEPESVALVGVGDIGRGILHYFQGRRPRLAIAALFDKDPDKVNRVIHGCRSYPVEEIARVVPSLKIRVAIISVPGFAAQDVADRLVNAGVRGILNYAPIRLKLPEGIYIENRDVILSLEKIAYFARQT